MSMNKILVIGNVGSDPEMRYTPSGSAVTSFRLATNRVYTTSDGERREETEWFTIDAWGRLAEQCNNYVTKGMKVYAEGRLSSRSWTGQDGQTRFRMQINADRVLFLDRRGEAPEGMGEAPPRREYQAPSGGGGTDAGAGQGGGQSDPAGDLPDLPW